MIERDIHRGLSFPASRPNIHVTFIQRWQDSGDMKRKHDASLSSPASTRNKMMVVLFVFGHFIRQSGKDGAFWLLSQVVDDVHE